MATGKKVSRKQLLKEPDEFLTFSAKLFQFILKYKVHAVSALGGLILVVLVVSGISYYFHKKASQAMAQLQTSWNRYEPLRTEKGSIEAFQAVSAEFENILAKYGGQPGGKIARVIFANMCFTAGEADRAIELYKAALGDFTQPLYRGQIFSGLGYAYESQKDLNTAAEYFEKALAESNNILHSEALFNLGRVHAELGNSAQSAEAYRKLVADYPESLYAGLARERIGGANVSPAAPATAPQ